MNTLNFSAQEDWTVRELIIFLRWLDILYNRLYVLEKLTHESEDALFKMLKYSLYCVPNRNRLSVEHIVIHSPGKISIKSTTRAFKLLSIVLGIYFGSLISHEHYSHQKEMNNMERINKLSAHIDNRLELSKKLKEKGLSAECIDEVLKKRVAPCADKLFHMMHKKQIKRD